jgi:hypothetical protein
MYVISHNVTHETCVTAIARAGVAPKLRQKGAEHRGEPRTASRSSDPT